ncbi:RNA-directed DNA polymerase, eukaryota, reverse transcriptase zinc-binding domain protein [Tanacetum coccineum]|uniref:RNA-directed DNA polymerase, eukaryota, reverse transcriptase zinc-binding domain protein n=1 Tax=Tanacetum coccineum TaxID=301880 RepID=A0ABQ4ZY44_9ASTR
MPEWVFCNTFLIEAMKKTANKYSVLETIPEDNPMDINLMKDIMIEKWEEDRRHENERNVLNETEEGNMEDDVLDDETVFIWNIRGKSNGNKQKEVMKFINDGKLQVCSIIETHIKDKKVKETCAKVMVFQEFLMEFNASHAIFQPFLVSDHSPCLLIIPTNWQKKPKSFRFANYIANKPEFNQTVAEGWKTQVSRNKMYCLVKKLKKMKPLRNKLNWKHEDLTARVEEFKVKLKEAQSLVEKDPYNKEVKVKAVEPLGRRSRNRVRIICDENGNSYEKEEVPLQFVKHFQQFLGNPSSIVDLALSDDLFSIVLTNADAEEMIKEVSEKEIMEAMFDIGDNKASGPEGFSSVFFKKAWNVVGKDVCDGIKEFFSNGQMLGELNATLITLVPKIQNPFKAPDFRPIACCNVLYKCINKIITNRIKGALKNLVQINQSAFIPDRLIQDNILLSQENIERIREKEWFGFHSKMVGWIRSVKIYLMLNSGDLHWTTVKNILKYLRNTKDMFLVYGANESGITKGARHFRAKVHYLREVIEFGDIKLEKVHTDDNLVDPFTKALAFSKHSDNTTNIGMLPANNFMQVCDD